MIAVSTYCIKIEPISFTNFRADRFNIINTIIISEQFPSIFYAEYHVISNFIGTMTCLSNLNHLSGDMQSSLSRFLDHPSRSKLRGIHLKIKRKDVRSIFNLNEYCRSRHIRYDCMFPFKQLSLADSI